MASGAAQRKRTYDLFKRQKGRCYYCGQLVRMVNTLPANMKVHRNKVPYLATFDHVIPKSKGGPNHISNGVCACQRCNMVRGNMPFERWKRIATSPKAVIAFHKRRKMLYAIRRVIRNSLNVIRLTKRLYKYRTNSYYAKRFTLLQYLITS